MPVMLGDGRDEDLEGFEELQFDRAPDANGEGHGHVHDHSREDDRRRTKRNLMLGLVGTILLIGSLWWAIARIQ